MYLPAKMKEGAVDVGRNMIEEMKQGIDVIHGRGGETPELDKILKKCDDLLKILGRSAAGQ
jgi:hypothetical protein